MRLVVVRKHSLEFLDVVSMTVTFGSYRTIQMGQISCIRPASITVQTTALFLEALLVNTQSSEVVRDLPF